MALKQIIFESSQKTLVKEQQKRSFAILYKTIDYRPKIYKNSLKITSILDKEILFKRFLFKMEKFVSYLEKSKKFSYNQLVIDNILGNLNNTNSYPVKNYFENELFAKELIRSNFTSTENFLILRGGFLNEIILESVDNLILTFNFLMNSNSKIYGKNCQKICTYKKFFKCTIIFSIIFLIFYLNRDQIQQLFFKFIKIFYKKKEKLIFQNKKILKKIKLIKTMKFNPLNIFTEQKDKLIGKKTLKILYKKIAKNEIKTFFKKLSNTIDGALKIKIKFKPFKKEGNNQEVDFNSTINKLFDLLSEDI